MHSLHARPFQNSRSTGKHKAGRNVCSWYSLFQSNLAHCLSETEACSTGETVLCTSVARKSMRELAWEGLQQEHALPTQPQKMFHPEYHKGGRFSPSVLLMQEQGKGSLCLPHLAIEMYELYALQRYKISEALVCLCHFSSHLHLPLFSSGLPSDITVNPSLLHKLWNGISAWLRSLSSTEISQHAPHKQSMLQSSMLSHSHI